MEHFSIITTREFLNKIGNKSFILMTILLPIILSGIGFLLTFLSSINNDTSKVISVVDKTGYIYEKLDSSNDIKYDLIGRSSSLDEARSISESKSDYGLLFIDNFDTPEKIAESIVFITEDSPSFSVIDRIESELETILTNENYRIEGIDINLINSSRIYINLFQESFDGEETSRIDGLVSLMFGFFLGFLLYFFIFAYGSMIMMSVIEEKTNRIVEIIISSVSSFELMMAKIIGVGLVGITQFIIWAIVTMIMSITIFPLIIKDKYNPSLQNNSEELVNNSLKIDPNNEAIQFIINEVQWSYLIVFFILFFLGGYLLYSGLMAAIGAAVDEEADTQQFLLPLTIPMGFAILMASKVIDDPSSSLAFWLSEIPFTSPIIMIVRIAMGIGDSSVEIWEIILSLFLLTITFIGTTWLSGRIYRKGILSYGKKASYSDLFKWLKN